MRFWKKPEKQIQADYTQLKMHKNSELYFKAKYANDEPKDYDFELYTEKDVHENSAKIVAYPED